MADVAKAIVEATLTALPEFDVGGLELKASPEVRAGDSFVFGEFCMEEITIQLGRLEELGLERSMGSKEFPKGIIRKWRTTKS